jgi:hypothetical protein
MAKQGVASAVNDVSRELGSAVGIAVMGSALNATYRDSMHQVLTGMPADIAARFERSVAFVKVDPHVVLAGKPGVSAILASWDGLVAGARAAFTHGMHVALTIAGGTALAAAVVIAVAAPREVARQVD